MCTYRHKVGPTYYFRRPVPKHLVGHFRTAKGAARTEWSISLRVKDRDQAKRPMRAGCGTLTRSSALSLMAKAMQHAELIIEACIGMSGYGWRSGGVIISTSCGMLEKTPKFEG